MLNYFKFSVFYSIHKVLIKSLAGLGFLTTLMGLSACGVEGGTPVTNSTLPANTPLQLNSCLDAGIYISTCVLSDANNPFRYVEVSDTTKWDFNNLKSLSNKAKFYMWATAQAKNPTGENQFYVAEALQNLYATLKSSNQEASTTQALAQKAYHSVLLNYYESTTQAAESAPIDFIPDTDFRYDNWSSTSYALENFNGNYTLDSGYSPVWKVQRSTTGWGAALAFDFSTGTGLHADKFNTMVFKIKSTDNSPFKVKFAGGTEKEIIVNLPTTVSNIAGVSVTSIAGKTGWNQVSINLATVFPNRNTNNTFAILENDTSFTVGNALYITDIAFTGDADSTTAGLYKDVNNDGVSYLYRSGTVLVPRKLRNWVGEKLINATGNTQLYGTKVAAEAQLTAWGYKFSNNLLTKAGN